MNEVWTAYEKEWLRQNAGLYKDQELAAKLTKLCGRKVTVKAIRQMRSRLGLKKSHGRGIYALSDTKTR